MQNPRQNMWLAGYIRQLLEGNQGARSLLAADGDPFQGRPPPTFIKVDRYVYSFVDVLDNSTAHWWAREFMHGYFRPLSLNDFSPQGASS